MRFITTVARWLRAVFRVDPVFTDSSPPAPAAAEDLPRSSYEERRAARIARNQEARRQREQDRAPRRCWLITNVKEK